MSENASAFFWQWLEINVPCTGRQYDIVEAGKLARKLLATAAHKGFTIEDLNLGKSSAATLIMEALAMKPDDRLSMPKSGHPFFAT